MFVHDTAVRLRHTDAAGVLFFAEQLALCHEAYEAYLDQVGLSLGPLLRGGQFGLPIVHAAIDLTAPLFVSDPLRIELRATRVGTSSFTLTYRLRRHDEVVGTAETVHVAIDGQSRQKMPLPDAVRRGVSGLLVEDRA